MPGRARKREQPLFGEPELGADPPPLDVEPAASSTPLAARMRPRTLDEFVGPGARARAGAAPAPRDRGRPSAVAHPLGAAGQRQNDAGPRHRRRDPRALRRPSAPCRAGVADLRKAVEEARARRRAGQRTILFIDEIHRFNKAQQDAILPYVEDGHGDADRRDDREPVVRGQQRAAVALAGGAPASAGPTPSLRRHRRSGARGRERGLAARSVDAGAEARARICWPRRGGDARMALQRARELAAPSAAPDADGVRSVDAGAGGGGAAAPRAALRQGRRRALRHDLALSSRALRGSDPDAALYWLARMIEAGEDPLFIVRRMVILAAEDVGLADPQALAVAMACQQAVHFIGMPEGFLPMAECAAVPGAGAEEQRGDHRVRRAHGGRRAPRATSRCRCTCATPSPG